MIPMDPSVPGDFSPRQRGEVMGRDFPPARHGTATTATTATSSPRYAWCMLDLYMDFNMDFNMDFLMDFLMDFHIDL